MVMSTLKGSLPVVFLKLTIASFVWDKVNWYSEDRKTAPEFYERN